MVNEGALGSRARRGRIRKANRRREQKDIIKWTEVDFAGTIRAAENRKK